MDQERLISEDCLYNEERNCWVIDIQDMPNNTLYYFGKNDNYFLDPNNPNIYIDGNIYYSVYKKQPKLIEDKFIVNCKINNKAVLSNYLPTVFLNDPDISLQLDIAFNKYLKKKIHIITIEWISPQETYYVMDKLLEIDEGETKITLNPHLKIDPSTMRQGIWSIRILVSNFLVKDLQFKLSSITY